VIFYIFIYYRSLIFEKLSNILSRSEVAFGSYH